MKPVFVLHSAQVAALVRAFPSIKDACDFVEMDVVKTLPDKYGCVVRYSFDYAKPKPDPLRNREAQWKRERRGIVR